MQMYRYRIRAHVVSEIRLRSEIRSSGRWPFSTLTMLTCSPRALAPAAHQTRRQSGIQYTHMRPRQAKTSLLPGLSCPWRPPGQVSHIPRQRPRRLQALLQLVFDRALCLCAAAPLSRTSARRGGGLDDVELLGHILQQLVASTKSSTRLRRRSACPLARCRRQ